MTVWLLSGRCCLSQHIKRSCYIGLHSSWSETSNAGWCLLIASLVGISGSAAGPGVTKPPLGGCVIRQGLTSLVNCGGIATTWPYHTVTLFTVGTFTGIHPNPSSKIFASISIPSSLVEQSVQWHSLYECLCFLLYCMHCIVWLLTA